VRRSGREAAVAGVGMALLYPTLIAARETLPGLARRG